MSAGGLLFAAAAVQGVMQIGEGIAKKSEADYNAEVLRGRAGLIDVQKDVENRQYQRLKRQSTGKAYASMAASGVMPSGSPMDVLLETQTQIGLDQAIGQFNLEQEKRFTLAEAGAIKRRGKQEMTAGIVGGLSSILQGAASYAAYSGGTKTWTTKKQVSSWNKIQGKKTIFG